MLVLASQSPRRRELLELAGLTFTCIPSEAEEIIPEGIPAVEVPEYLARQKAEDIAKSHPEDVILGADTIVICGDEILGKPKSEEDACRMLRELSGRTHHVCTGCAIIRPGRKAETFRSVTEVEFYPLSEKEIHHYVKTGEPMDKAGAYGIQGRGALLVRQIRGDYCTVVGLPIAQVWRHLPDSVKQ